MKRILCTGDSHTWGQGAKGILEELDTPAVAGDLRLVSFRNGSYVNRLRRYVERATGSRSFEWLAAELAEIGGAPFSAPCAMIGDKPLKLKFTGQFLRVEYSLGSVPCEWELTVDGAVEAHEVSPAAAGENCYRFVCCHTGAGEHELELRVLSGVLPLFRIESYDGDFAVINSGVGSCPTFQLSKTFFKDHVADIRPDIILAEAQTINDWLQTPTVNGYAKNLEALLTSFEELGAQVVLMTVSPVEGGQRWQGGPLYGDYVEASRQVAKKLGIPLCDANKPMCGQIFGMTEQEAMSHLFSDPWHPNDLGHTIYARMLAGALEPLIGKKIDTSDNDIGPIEL